jgi:WD40 repeat protein
MTQPGAVALTVPHDGSADAVAFSADSKHVASGGTSATIDVRAVGTGQQHTIPAKGFVTSLAFAPDGTTIAVADLDTVALWDAHTGTAPLWSGPIQAQQSINAVRFTPNGAAVIACTDTLVAVLDAKTGELLRQWNVEVQIADVDLSADGTLLAVAIDQRHGGDHHNAGAAVIFEVGSGTERQRITPTGAVYAVAFDPDATVLLCAYADDPTGAAQATVAVFSLSTTVSATAPPKPEWTLAVDATGLAFGRTNEDGQSVVVGGADGLARVLDSASGIERSRVDHDGAVTHVALAPDGKWAASTGIDDRLQVFSTTEQVTRYAVGTAEGHALAFSADSRWLALGQVGSAVVYDNGAAAL